MVQQDEREGRSGIYLSPMAQRRSDFAQACGPLFARLEAVDGIDAALAALAAAPVDVLVIDLERFERSIDLDALGALVARRAGAPTLVLCPYAVAAWIPALMAYGPLAYAITPLDADATRARVARCLDGADTAAADDSASLRELLALRARVQETLAEAEAETDGANRLAEALCAALRSWPGVLHAGVFLLKHDGDLQLEAQDGAPGLLLGAVLQRTDHLLQAPLRHAFPGLLAAASGETVLLETLEQAGEPTLTDALRGHGVTLALGVPIPADGPIGGPLGSYNAPRGALSLLFAAPRRFGADDWRTLADIASLAARGLRACALVQENEHLLARLTYISTTDALTGVANRRHGEALLEQEIKRARRYRLPLALLSIDIDRFKLVNDTFGYPVGDIALRTVADTARAGLRASDILIRSGGEEFHIIAPHTSAIDGLKIAEKVRLAVEQAEIPGCDHVTVSVGVAQLGEQESSDSLVQRADAAMGRAKRAGRNCVELAMQ